jgi:PAS domain S-box-containing protein
MRYEPKNCNLKRSQTFRKSTVIAAVAVVLFILAIVFKPAEIALTWHQAHEKWGVDELIIAALILVLVLYISLWWNWMALHKDKRAKQEIETLKQQIEFIIGATKTGLDIIDSQFNIRYIDPEWQKVYGDPTGKKCYEYFMGRNEVCPGCGIVKALETKSVTVTEELVVKENNRPIHVTTIPFQNSSGEWLVAEVNVDISERKKAEEALRESENKYRTLVENLPQKIFLKDANSVYISCNEAYARDLKIGPGEIAGKTDYDFYPKKLAEKYRVDDKRIIESAETKDIEEEYLQDGQKRVVHTVKTPVKDEKGGVVGVLGIFWDITKFKQAEEEMESMNRKLQATVEELTQSNNELQEFVHVASHDLKTPLQAIGILADWILTDYGDKFDESGRERVKLLVGRAKRIDELIGGLLQYFQVGHTRGKYEEVDLNIVLSEVIREIAPPENIEITIQSELPTVIGEQRRMVQIFQNLLNNAIKYIEKPRGEIKVGCVEEDGFWKFSVCDNGSGIEQKYFGKLFKVFQKLESHDESEGTGIGLAIVKKIVELYGGRVCVESRPREGSTFFFTLPKKEMGVKNAKLKANIACGR